MLRETQDFPGTKAPTDDVVQEKVMQLIRSYQILGTLGNLTLDGREQLWRNRGVKNVFQDVGQFLVLFRLSRAT